MIPKIAHFHWTGPTMSWLRLVSIATFKKHNPGWEIRLHDTPDDIREHGLLYGQEADWTWWRVLAEHGGLQVATDIIFTKPIPDEWLECDFCACTNGSHRVWQFAVMGAKPQHEFFVMCEDLCGLMDVALLNKGKHRGRFGGYQIMGVNLLKSAAETYARDGDKTLFKKDFFDIPMSALCHIDDTRVPLLWDDRNIELPDEAIGVHWYGGHALSKEKEYSTFPYDGSEDSFLRQLALREWL